MTTPMPTASTIATIDGSLMPGFWSSAT